MSIRAREPRRRALRIPPASRARVDRRVAAFGRADRPWTAGIVWPGLRRVVGPCAPCGRSDGSAAGRPRRRRARESTQLERTPAKPPTSGERARTRYRNAPALARLDLEGLTVCLVVVLGWRSAIASSASASAACWRTSPGRGVCDVASAPRTASRSLPLARAASARSSSIPSASSSSCPSGREELARKLIAPAREPLDPGDQLPVVVTEIADKKRAL